MTSAFTPDFGANPFVAILRTEIKGLRETSVLPLESAPSPG